MVEWLRYVDTVDRHTVTGELLIHKGFYSPQLDNRRDVLVWLPPGYGRGERRYPVIYMHDGQNLFDEATSNTGEWLVDETMTQLSTEGLEAIIVGLPHMYERRRIEYDPYPPALGESYTAFLVETVKPMIDADFRTLPDAAHTGVGGSSMGGLISLYAFLTRPQVFDLCAAFSTAYWFGAEGLLSTIQEHASGYGRIYLDVGTSEGDVLYGFAPEMRQDPAAADQAYVDGVRRVRDVLLGKGYSLDQNLVYVEDAGARHIESAWAARLPDAFRFLLGDSGRGA